MCPSIQCHKEKTQNFSETFDFLYNSKKNYYDWESIILFYCSLHCVQYFFGSPAISKHPDRHKKIKKLMAKHLKKYAYDYSLAFTISIWARYEDVEINETMRDTCKRAYDAVKNLVPL